MPWPPSLRRTSSRWGSIPLPNSSCEVSVCGCVKKSGQEGLLRRQQQGPAVVTHSNANPSGKEMWGDKSIYQSQVNLMNTWVISGKLRIRVLSNSCVSGMKPNLGSPSTLIKAPTTAEVRSNRWIWEWRKMSPPPPPSLVIPTTAESVTVT